MKYLFIPILVSVMLFSPKAQAQTFEVQQLILDVEKLTELKNILNDLYKGYEVLSTGYNAIKNISQGNFNLHQLFLDGLLAVSPAVKNYKRVIDIITCESNIVSEYKKSFSRFKGDGYFNPDEISYLASVYTNLINQSAKNIDALLMVITASSLRMSDAERLKAIDKLYEDTLDKLMFLRHFNSTTQVLEAQRVVEQSDAKSLKKMYDE